MLTSHRVALQLAPLLHPAAQLLRWPGIGCSCAAARYHSTPPRTYSDALLHLSCEALGLRAAALRKFTASLEAALCRIGKTLALLALLHDEKRSAAAAAACSVLYGLCCGKPDHDELPTVTVYSACGCCRRLQFGDYGIAAINTSAM